MQTIDIGFKAVEKIPFWFDLKVRPCADNFCQNETPIEFLGSVISF